MWKTPVGEMFSYTGKVHSVVDSPGLPKPAQADLPIIIGGGGPKRTPALAAQYASEFNLPFPTVDAFTSQCANVRAACQAIGRDPSAITYSTALVLCCGADEAEVTRRAATIGREPSELRANGAAGTVNEVADTLRRWHAAGAERIYLQALDVTDLDHIALVAEQVRPLLG